jgi:hypothetical protein
MNITVRLSMMLLSFMPMLVMAEQICLETLENTTKTGRFRDQLDGTTYDLNSGLLWTACAYGQVWSDGSCTGVAEKLTLAEALVAADDLTFAGYQSWRLPNINELQSLIEWSCVGPAANKTFFPDLYNSYYLSASARDIDGVPVSTVVDFYSGRARDALYNTNYVFFVRDMH